MNVETIKRIAAIFLAACFIALLVFYSRNRKERIKQNVRFDTNLVSRYSAEQRRDTVFKWTDRIVYKNPKPEVVYVQKTDTVFLGGLKNYDFPLRIEKTGGALDIKAVSFRDSVLKEYVYSNISGDFTVTAKDGGLQVKSRNFLIEKPCLSLRTLYIPAEKKFHYEVSAETGVSFREKLSLLGGCGYTTSDKNIFLTMSIKYKGL
ncbi:MAG: hypothetical protein LWX07_06265 [Bacteroidetes bacterium]|nr:hypothetical protein [Bacteroidota bacterium]